MLTGLLLFICIGLDVEVTVPDLKEFTLQGKRWPQEQEWEQWGKQSNMYIYFYNCFLFKKSKWAYNTVETI